MTVTLFISIFVAGSTVSAFLTEAIKKAFENAKKEASPNIIALADAIIVGGLGTAVCYMLMDIPWTTNNIICLCLMAVLVWMGSMLGFDKIKQMLNQLKEVK